MSARHEDGPSERGADRRSPPHQADPDLFRRGDRVTVVHAKPWKRTVTMRGYVTAWDGTMLTLERQFTAGGLYDSLNVPKLAGDWGTIEVPQGGWVLRRAYYRQDGELIGELFNIQQPAVIDRRGVRYVDLEVDVVRMPLGNVTVVDEDDLEAAVRSRGISRALADTARTLAYRLADILRVGGDWRTADAHVEQI